jgi:hypothetical protein
MVHEYRLVFPNCNPENGPIINNVKIDLNNDNIRNVDNIFKNLVCNIDQQMVLKDDKMFCVQEVPKDSNITTIINKMYMGLPIKINHNDLPENTEIMGIQKSRIPDETIDKLLTNMNYKLSLDPITSGTSSMPKIIESKKKRTSVIENGNNNILPDLQNLVLVFSQVQNLQNNDLSVPIVQNVSNPQNNNIAPIIPNTIPNFNMSPSPILI